MVFDIVLIFFAAYGVAAFIMKRLQQFGYLPK